MSYAPPSTPQVESRLVACDPRAKLAWLVAVSLAGVLIDGAVALAILCASTLVVALTMRWDRRMWLVVGAPVLAVAWGTMLSQAMFYAAEPRTVILTLVPEGSIGGLHFPGLRMYREGFSYGLVQSLRMIAVMLAGLSVCLSTSPERLLAALAWSGVPEAIGFMSVAALRFLPTMVDQWSTVRRACRLRGFRPQYFGLRNLTRTLRVELALLVPVVASALRRASTLATSITVRGFDATKRRTLYPQLAMSRAEAAGVIVLGLAILGLAMLKSLYWLSVGGQLRISALQPIYDFVARWL